jgi:hypothetical protein
MRLGARPSPQPHNASRFPDQYDLATDPGNPDSVTGPAHYRGALPNFAATRNDLPAARPRLHGWHGLCIGEYVQSV